MRRIGCLLIFAVVASMAVWPQALPQTQTQRAPKILTIDPTFPDVQGSWLGGINDVGAIVGTYFDSNFVEHGFLRTPDGKYVQIDVPVNGLGQPQATEAADINLWGEIIGDWYDENGVQHGFLRKTDGTYIEFDAPGAGDNSTGWHTYPSQINIWGTIVGWYLDENMVIGAFVRAPDGKFTTYEGPGAGTDPGNGSQAVAINDWGLISGNTNKGPTDPAYVRKLNGNFIEFGCPDPNFLAANAVRINLTGMVAAYCSDMTWTINHAFVRMPNGKAFMIEPPSTKKETVVGSQAFGINLSGAVAAFYVDGNGVTHGYVWTPDGKITKFDAPGAGTQPGMGTWPWAINLEGQIIGYYVDENGVVHGFLRMGDK